MTSNLDNRLNEILFDVQFNAGQFADNSLASDEVRDLAVEAIHEALRVAGYGPAATAGA